jgi:F0F1-type ATP synthase assembly protein I
MTYRHDILDELNALKGEATRMLGTRAEEWREASGQKAKDIAADVKAFLSDFRDALALEEEEIERAFAGRASAALASALALGIVIGWALRRKP